MNRRRYAMATILLTAVVGLLPGAISPGTLAVAGAPRLAWSVTIDGQDTGKFDSGRPLQLNPQTSLQMSVHIDNSTARPVSVRNVRLQGRVLGLTFFSYTTRVDMQVAPGAQEERDYSVDLLDLDRQATGLIPSSVLLLDPAGHLVAARSFTVDVRGSWTAVYGLFGLAVTAITVLLLASTLRALFLGRMHPNRWRRAMSFAAPGLGVGFVLTFALSAFRLLVPWPTLWTSLILMGGAVGFAAGYLSPTPELPGSEADFGGDRSAGSGSPGMLSRLFGRSDRPADPVNTP